MAYSAAQNEATKRYFTKLKSLSTRLQPDQYDYYKSAAKRLGLPLRQFVLVSMDEFIENHLKKV